MINNKLIDCLNRNSPAGEKLGDALAAQQKHATNKSKVVVPVLGTQGMGKSTLINALLKADILPSDADETTCVPVEVSYADKEYAEVSFLNGNPTVIVHSKQELNEYVDNNCNPANQKRVDCIRLYRKADILRSGITIVDLPGVGSITKENEKTTMRYIENTSIAIFMIPTVPTIRSSEAMFIQGAWSQFSQAMFVQNDFGETAQEKKDSVEHNTLILQQIAGKIGTELNNPIMVINARDAIDGALSSNQQVVKESGILVLENRINTFASDWELLLKKGCHSRIINTIKRVIGIIDKRLEELSKNADEVRQQRQKEYSRFREENEKILSQIDDIISWLGDTEPKANKEIRKKAQKTAGDIRSDMWQIIKGGVFDGERLNEAFCNVQESSVPIFFDDAVEYLGKINNEFESKMEILADAIKIQNDFTYTNVEHQTESKTKWEKAVNVLFNVGGALGGYYKAASLAALIISNPAGWFVAGVGLAIAGVASFLGYSAKKKVQQKRADEAKRDLEPKIDEVEKKLYKTTCDKNHEVFTAACEFLEQLKATQEERERAMRRAVREPLNPQETESLKEDRTYLEKTLKEL